ncbi:MAG: hypothetical protein LAP40_21375 [Acidobacteriia bacterium]|nr:hypothetical protein [Terriglobia bacterium]
MRFRLGAVLFAFALAAGAQTLSIRQLMIFLESSVRLKQTDKEVAGYLSHAKLNEKLDDRAIEQLESLGIGPKTLAALHALRDQSEGLQTASPIAPDAKPAPKPPPSSEEQAAIITDVRDYALNYSKSLPDYICTQVTRRYLAAAPGGRYAARSGGSDPSWQLQDTLTIRLSYFEQKEDYKLILVNNTLTQGDYTKLSGTVATGDFGTMLRQIFEPATETHFEWSHWATMRGRLSYVFAYHVAGARSQWHISDRENTIITAYQGLVYVDQQTREVLRITVVATDIPGAFPIHSAEDILDYDFQTLGDHEFLLPLKGEVRMSTGDVLARNDNEFRLYHKYSTESEIKYDTPDPLPDAQTSEQPQK